MSVSVFPQSGAGEGNGVRVRAMLCLAALSVLAGND
jgi:hypothetical protein